MLGLGAIEIEEATYNVGMCGHIVVRINATGKAYRINHTMLDGWQVSECNGQEEWSRHKRMTPDEFIGLLPKDRGWTCGTFIAVWAGYAAGYGKGLCEGRFREREKRAQTASCKAST